MAGIRCGACTDYLVPITFSKGLGFESGSRHAEKLAVTPGLSMVYLDISVLSTNNPLFLTHDLDLRGIVFDKPTVASKT